MTMVVVMTCDNSGSGDDRGSGDNNGSVGDDCGAAVE